MKYSIVFLCILGWIEVQAQDAMNAAGSIASGSGGSVSYSVGQMVCTTNVGTNGSVAQGVQQPFEISVLTGLEQAVDISLHYSAYPNPATDYLILKVQNYNKENLSYQLTDINGKILENKKIIGTETRIVMSNLYMATYFLKIILNSKETRIFKIVKN